MSKQMRIVAVTVQLWLAANATAAPSDRIDKAVERGLVALRELQQQNGCWGSYGAGSTSLAGLTLLECGAKRNDPAVLRAAEFVRTEIAASAEVYHVSLAIMFLDRLEDASDEPLIQALAVRLMEGQHPYSGWSYRCGKPSDEEVQRLRTSQQKGVELRTDPKKAPAPERPRLDPDLERRLEALERNGQPDPGSRGDGGAQSVAFPDNSNSQFAVLAVWVARRHGINSDAALRRVEVWYRATFDSGTWPYTKVADAHGRAATTCAGLIGLAVGAGVVRSPAMKTQPDKTPKPIGRNVLADIKIQTGLNYVGRELAAAGTLGIAAGNSERDYYFLWSLERVGMIYSLNRLGGIDWYAVGSNLILQHQQPNGQWRGRYTAEVDTSFALLFLRRSNVASDLSGALRAKDGKQQPVLSSKEAEETKLPATNSPIATEADRLARELPAADASRQDQILESLREEKGAEYTDALTKVIPQLKDDLQRRARDCLADRMSRMTVATLRARLRDENAELRRAAALACAAKDDRSLVADLIAIVEDKDAGVMRAVVVALRSLTGEDFGPPANAKPEERAKAIVAWKAWWKKQSP